MKKTFILTGSSRGLGRSIAAAILEAGHQLVATARQPDQLAELAVRHGDRMLAVRLDVTDYGATQRAVAAGLERFGKLDVVVGNAGFANVGSVEDMPVGAIEAQFATNFMGSVHLVKAALPALRERGAGHIIQISSIGARIATAGAAAYYASKWALAGFFESLALEVEPLGIHVTAIEPGGMKTDFANDTSLTIFPASAPYLATAGATATMMKAPGYSDTYADPARIAALVLKVVDQENPPVRLLAGGGTYDYATQVDVARSEADRHWEWLSRTVD